MHYRLATPTDSLALANIACACASELTENFTMQLGRRFHRAYYQIVLSEPSTVVACAEDENSREVMGFAFGTLDSAALMQAFRRNRLRLGFSAAFRVFVRPWLMFGLAKRALALNGSRGGEEYVVANGAKVSFLAVRPEGRKGQVGPNLMRHVLQAMKQAGAGAIQAEVDESNPRVIRMHCRLGAKQIEKFRTPSGIERVILEYPASTEAEAA